MQISYAECHANQKINVESADRNYFTPLSCVRFHKADIHEAHIATPLSPAAQQHTADCNYFRAFTVTVTGTICTTLVLYRQVSVKNAYADCHENPINESVAK